MISSTRSAPFYFPGDNPTVLAKRSSLTRKSIKKFYPGQTKDNSNPIMLHSSNDELYPILWSFLAETMIAQGELPSDAKEAVALRVNSASKRRPSKESQGLKEQGLEGARKEQAVKYAETLLSSNESSGDSTSFPLLGDAAKAEVALVILLFRHLSRSVTALLGEHHKSKGLLSISCPPERQSFDAGVKGVVQRMMIPTKAKPGLTSPLFSPSFFFGGSGHAEVIDLPDHLKAAMNAGEDCASALSRLVAWVKAYEAQLCVERLLTKDLLQQIQQAVPPPHLKPHQLAQWVSSDLRPQMPLLQGKRDNLQWDLVSVLLMIQYSPESVAKSCWLKELIKDLGKDKATTIVLWWSLRITLAEAKGLVGYC